MGVQPAGTTLDNAFIRSRGINGAQVRLAHVPDGTLWRKRGEGEFDTRHASRMARSPHVHPDQSRDLPSEFGTALTAQRRSFPESPRSCSSSLRRRTPCLRASSAGRRKECVTHAWPLPRKRASYQADDEGGQGTRVHKDPLGGHCRHFAKQHFVLEGPEENGIVRHFERHKARLSVHCALH